MEKGAEEAAEEPGKSPNNWGMGWEVIKSPNLGWGEASGAVTPGGNLAFHQPLAHRGNAPKRSLAWDTQLDWQFPRWMSGIPHTYVFGRNKESVKGKGWGRAKIWETQPNEEDRPPRARALHTIVYV